MNDELIRLAIKLSEYSKNYGEDDPDMWADLDKLGELARAAEQQNESPEGKAAPAGDASASGGAADRHTNAGETPAPLVHDPEAYRLLNAALYYVPRPRQIHGEIVAYLNRPSQKPAHDREPPHCPSCSCGQPENTSACEHKNRLGEATQGVITYEVCAACGKRLI